MAIYKLKEARIADLIETSFAAESILERRDLQRSLREKIAIISPHTLVISEEFGEWEGSKRRIDLLGVDKEARLVVIELKRNEIAILT
jgi:RecB family endonuclease NucS